MLNGKLYSRITLDLHGKCLDTTYSGNALAVFDQPTLDVQYQVSLFPYLQNCLNGSQVLTIPLSAYKLFSTSLNPNLNTVRFRIKFYYTGQMNFDVTSVQVYDTLASPAPTLAPTPSPTILPSPTASPSPSVTPSPTPTPSPSPYWPLRSVDVMKWSKDVVCNQPSDSIIAQQVSKAVSLGVTHIAISTPYDSPACGDSVAFTTRWVNAIRAGGLKVWHRHMPLAFEGIYNVPKDNSTDYLSLITNYITSHPSLFANGDIVTPIPEPENAGFTNWGGCPQGVCQFANQTTWNKWMRDAVASTSAALTSINVVPQKVGYFGTNGFLVWGDNNSYWQGRTQLEQATIDAQGGEISIDHYPAANSTMAQDLDELHTTLPNVNIVISEYGTINATNSAQQVQQITDTFNAFKRPWIKGASYWHLGHGGNEALINSDYTNKAGFTTLSAYFHGE